MKGVYLEWRDDNIDSDKTLIYRSHDPSVPMVDENLIAEILPSERSFNDQGAEKFNIYHYRIVSTKGNAKNSTDPIKVDTNPYIISTSSDNFTAKVSNGGDYVFWTYKLDTSGYHVAVDFLGNVYIGDNSGLVIKLNVHGVTSWINDNHSNRVNGITVDNNGFVYSGSSDNTVRKIDPDGNEVWSFNGHGSNVNSVEVDLSGFVYSGSSDNTVRKIDPDGNEVWSFNGHSSNVNGIACNGIGEVYSGSSDNTVKKIDSVGNEVWSFNGHSSIVQDVSVGKNGYVYSTSSDNTLKKITPEGQEVWSRELASTGLSVSVDLQDSVYVASSSIIYKFDTDGNEIWKFNDHSSTVRGICVEPGRFYISQGYAQ